MTVKKSKAGITKPEAPIKQLIKPECLPDILPKCSCPPPEPRCPRRKQILNRMIMPTSQIASSIGGPLSIERIEVGSVSIPNLSLKGFKGDFSYALCKAKNVELELTLSIKTTFTGSIDLPWPLCWSDFCYDVSGGVDLATFTEKYQLGNVTFQSGSFSMVAPATTVSPFSMTPQPIQGTTIEEVTTENVQMKCTSIPLDNPVGIKIGLCIPIQNMMEPNDVITDETDITKMVSKNIKSVRVAMKDISALNIKIPKVTTKGFEARTTTPVTVTTTKKMYGSGVALHGDAKDAHITGTLTLNVQKMIMRVKGGLEFKDVKGKVTTDTAISDKLEMDLILRRIKIKGLNLCGMKIPSIEVEI
jgi:hypothetical protein